MKFIYLSLIFGASYIFGAALEQKQSKQESEPIEDFAINYNHLLFFGAKNGDVKLIEHALENGASANVKTKRIGETPILLAVTNGEIDAVKALIDASADVNIGNVNMETPLFRAIENIDVECVDLLVSAKADVNAVDRNLRNSLHSCCHLKREDKKIVAIASILINAKANLEAVSAQDLDTPLQYAVKRKVPIKLVNIFLENGADVDHLDAKERTPLQNAVYYANVEAIEPLIVWGSDLEARSKEDLHNTPIQFALWNAHTSPQKLEISMMLLNAKADIDAALNYGTTDTILDCMTGQNRLQMLPFALSHAASIAKPIPNQEQLKLIANNLQLGNDAEQSRCLITATLLDNYRHVQNLLKQNLSAEKINKVDRLGNTALIWACARENIAIVKALLNYGIDNNYVVDADLFNEAGESAAYYAGIRMGNAKKVYELYKTADHNCAIQINTEICSLLYDYLAPKRKDLLGKILESLGADYSPDCATLISEYIYGAR